GKKIGPDPRNFNQRVSLGRNDLLIRIFLRFRMMQTILKSRVNVLPYINEQRLNKLNPPENLRIAIEKFGWNNKPITA
ncbi:hypothetical protein, partial [Escherichia coli]|uniref:hypothetical protein n=1 Tax=Escherichia coli TaxID=562 RepID=UPI001BC84FDB